MQVVERSVVPMDEMTLILGALNALKRGDTAVRLPLEWSGVSGRVSEVFKYGPHVVFLQVHFRYRL